MNTTENYHGDDCMFSVVCTQWRTFILEKDTYLTKHTHKRQKKYK